MINPSTANNAKETETAVRAQACDHGDQDHGHADDDQALLSMRHRRTLTRAAQHPPQEVGKAGAVPLTHDRHLPRRRWLEASRGGIIVSCGRGPIVVMDSVANLLLLFGLATSDEIQSLNH